MRPLRVAAFALGTMLILVAVAFIVSSEDPGGLRTVPVEESGASQRATCPSGTAGRITCLVVETPENYDDPEIRSVEIFIARVEPPLGAVEAPLAFVGRDIGVPAASDFSAWQSVSRELEREILLIDLRGVGGSNPRLGCFDVFGDDWLQADLVPDELLAARRAALDEIETCRERLERDLPIEEYSLDAMARDLDGVRQQLDIDSWVLVAGGGATAVVRRTQLIAPESVDSLVLLGAAPSSPDPQRDRYEYAAEVLDAALEPRTLEALDEVRNSLVDQTIVFPVQVRGRTQRVLVSNETLNATLARAVADPEFRGNVDAFVAERLVNREWRPLAQLRGTQRGDIMARSTPAALAVKCSEGPLPAPGSTWLDDGFDAAWSALLDDPVLDPLACAAWPLVDVIGPLPAPSVPTLVVNGEFDVTAPASAASSIAETWPEATTLVFESGQPIVFEPCVMSAVTSFLTVGEPRLDDTC